MRTWKPRPGAGYALVLAMLFLALAPSQAAAQQTTVQRLGTPSLSAQPGQTVTLGMRFNAVPMPENYYVFVHFVDANGVQHSTLNADHLPPVGTSQWSGAVAYNVTKTLPSNLAHGTYTIRVGLYSMAAPLNRIALSAGTGVTVDGERRYTVGTLTVGNPQPTTSTVLQLSNPSLSAQPGQTVTLGMRFNAIPMPENYYVFVHFVDASGVQHSSLNADHQPPVGTSQWSGAVAYNVTRTLPSNLATGTYTIRVGLYSMAAPLNRIPLIAGSGVTVDGETRYTVGTLTVSGGTTTSGGPRGQDANQYVLTFSDEFDSGFNTSKWNDHIWYESPNPTINYKVSNSSLKIWPQRDASGNFFNRTIDTDGKFSQTYGYFEMEAKLPIGKGVWPAFWLYAHPGNDRPEIDIMEAYPGGGPGSWWGDANLHPVNYGLTLHKANADYTYHEKPYETKLRDFAPYTNGVDLSAAFHTYAVKWEPSGITFYFDGQQLGPKYQDTAGYYNRPMYILLDLWFGSASGTPDGSTPTGEGNSFEVKYVRAWRFK
ncbi:glycoside hydrolase family 16 protein [Pyxidicoccus xibeiensis]|uniref:glycoside hydrolase family 16 protein n=1 Tax=Pyxidicoccus xibeiensis TaxID=2906759 RepID=UPI0020A81933|nr:glycoside hydrolase family 16 protein [Pyxidicoccus xibeiensis]MCP3138259.1 glycoside hydrolase family 16 protein [Pyxidicoccus xibeiensis]